MNSLEKIQSYIDKLINVFPTIKCTYEFNYSCDVHLVQILPLYLLEENERYEEITNGFLNDFYKENINEGLYFINRKSVYKLDNPIFSKSGVGYSHFTETPNYDISYQTTHDFFDVLKSSLEGIFNKTDFDWRQIVRLNELEINDFTLNRKIGRNFKLNDKAAIKKFNTNLNINEFVDIVEPEFSYAEKQINNCVGENNYAIAA